MCHGDAQLVSACTCRQCRSTIVIGRKVTSSGENEQSINLRQGRKIEQLFFDIISDADQNPWFDGAVHFTLSGAQCALHTTEFSGCYCFGRRCCVVTFVRMRNTIILRSMHNKVSRDNHSLANTAHRSAVLQSRMNGYGFIDSNPTLQFANRY